jgi:hypothetical protein
MSKQWKQLTVKFEPELMDWIWAQSALHKISKGEVIRSAVLFAKNEAMYQGRLVVQSNP